jgi:Arc/MetJ-type ribon-helix-helix transcriptional regulator
MRRVTLHLPDQIVVWLDAIRDSRVARGASPSRAEVVRSILIEKQATSLVVPGPR